MKLKTDQELIREYLARNPRPAYRTSPPPLTTLEERMAAERIKSTPAELPDPIETEAGRDNRNHDNGFDGMAYDSGRDPGRE